MIHRLQTDSIEALIAAQTLTWVGKDFDQECETEFILYSDLDSPALRDTYRRRLHHAQVNGEPPHLRWIQRIRKLDSLQKSLALRHIAHGNDMEAALTFAEGP